ncbi:Rav1p [Sporobolomyces salmoneus]|uniref:Rav1p n=1 Tax=Sporobolomyces salmoneus TaxID=183962 RepID=UPI0031759A85
MNTTLELQQAALPAPNEILSTILFGRPHLVATANDSIYVLDESATLINSISFRAAFPHLSEAAPSESSISSIAVDQSSNRIVASVQNKLAIFESTSTPDRSLGQWRVHSSFTTQYGKIETVDFRQDMIVLQAGGQVVVYVLKEEYALPSWKLVAILPFSLPISHLRLTERTSPTNDERILAVLPRQAATCIIYDLSSSTGTPSTSADKSLPFHLVFRSRASNSVRLKSIDWRNPRTSGSSSLDDYASSSSEPILMTTTIQNKIHLWGCVIDEPSYFSLWITLPSPPPPLPSSSASLSTPPAPARPGGIGRSPLVPLEQNQRAPQQKEKAVAIKRAPRVLWTGYWKTRKAVKGNGREDLFWSLFEDGQFYLTTVSNLDSRPPTCLTSQTRLIRACTSLPLVPRDHLAYFRHTHLLLSRSSPNSTLHLISCSSWSALLHTRLDLSLSPSSSGSASSEEESKTITRVRFEKPAISFVGFVRKLIRSFPTGENFTVLGTSLDTSDNGRKKVRIQSWENIELEGDEAVVNSREESVSDLTTNEGNEEGKKLRVATWYGGKRVVVGQGSKLLVYDREEATRLKLLREKSFDEKEGGGRIDFDDAKAFFVVRRSEDDLQTWIVAVTKVQRTSTSTSNEYDEKKKPEDRTYDYALNSWIYHSPSRQIFPGAPSRSISTSPICSDDATIVWVSIVPPPPLSASSSSTIDQIQVQSVDSEGCVRTWTLDLTIEEPEWMTSREGLKTGRKGVRRSSSRGNGVIALATDNELSIWNDRNRKFGNALEFSLPLEEKTISLEFSIDTNLLSLATPTKVLLFIPTRRQSQPQGASSRWKQVALITPATPSPITNLQFHSFGLSIACQSQLFFHSFALLQHKIDQKGNKFAITKKLELEVKESTEPLRLISHQLLRRMIEFGHLDSVRKLFTLIAKELDEDGNVIVRLESTDSSARSRFGIDEILDDFERKRKRVEDKSVKGDVANALSTAAELALRQKANDLESTLKLSDSDRSRLVLALSKGNTLRGVSSADHVELKNLVQTVYDVQGKLNTTDEFGIRYLASLRSLVNSNPSSLSLSPLPNDSPVSLDSRDLLFAFHSKDQQVLLDESINSVQSGEGKLSWENAKTLGIPLWLRDRECLLHTIELIGRTSFLLSPDSRDPILPMLFYLSLRRLPQVYTFWKQSLGHSDQRQMLKFLSNDFEQERWKSAARKNAFALLSKRRFLFAAAFFLLGDSLSDCCSVILRHLSDPLLAIAIARTYEVAGEEGGEVGPVLREILEKTVLPKALSEGDRFLSSLVCEMLGEKELSGRVLIDSIPTLTTKFEKFKFDSIPIDPMDEDPVGVIFVQRLLQEKTGKEVLAFFEGKNESEFVLYGAILLCESGYHLLALDLVQSYRFIPPPDSPPPNSTNTSLPTSAAPAPKPKLEPTNFVEPDTSSLFDMFSPAPSATTTKKTVSPSPQSDKAEEREKEQEKEVEEEEADEAEKQKRLFREASGIGKPKVETKNTVEAFSFDAFGF